MNIIFIAVFGACVCLANGQSCRTPSGDNGDCIAIRNCQPLWKLVENRHRTSQDVDLLRKSNCGYKDNAHQVCCPKQPPPTPPPPQQESACYTPEGTAGQCINLFSCPHIRNKLRLPVSQDVIADIQKYRCKAPDHHSVCCGPAPGLGRNTDVSVNICKNMMSAFPPDPRTECCGVDSNMDSRIVGGDVTAIDKYPWLALIEYEQTRNSPLSCGGVLVSGRYVMTAAHCVATEVLNGAIPKRVRLGEYDTSNEGPDCQRVEAGSVDCTDGVTRIEIEKIIPHPQYDPVRSFLRNDIALIRLKELAPFTDFIRPICLPTKDLTLPENTPTNFSLYASGWGAVSTKQAFSDVKMDVELPYVPLETCQRAYGLAISLRKDQLCAGGQAGKDTCKGDSGGPLMYRNGKTYELIGIVNFGLTPCGIPGIPGVSSKVYEYLGWIRRTIVA